MNNKGQSLVIFVLILPVIALFLAFFIDSGMVLLKKTKLEGIMKSNIEMSLKEDKLDEQELMKVIKSNSSDINLKYEEKDNILKITGTLDNKSVFGKILKTKWYDLKVSYCIDKEEKIIKSEC